MQDISERTFQFALRIVRLCQRLDEKPGVTRTLGKQILRSGTSVGANVREAQAGQSKPDFISKNAIALKEIHETGYWLDLLAEANLVKSELLAELRDECDQLTAILTSIVKHARDNMKREKVKGRREKGKGRREKGEGKREKGDEPMNEDTSSFSLRPFHLLKPYPKMKDSGVEWLGDVPEHWKVVSLRYLVSVKSGGAPPVDKYVLGRYPVFGANGIIGHCSRFNSKEPCVVVGRVGAAGAINVSPLRAWITDNVLIVDPLSQSILSTFLPHLLNAVDLASLTSQSAQPLITGGHIKARKATFPPLPEQRAIVRYLDYVDRRVGRYVRAKCSGS